MIVLGRARLPSQELVKIEKDVMDHLEGERNAELGVFQVMGAFTLIRRMPPATIQKHIQKLLWWVTNGEERGGGRRRGSNQHTHTDAHTKVY